MCPMTTTAGILGLLATLPIVGGLVAFLPRFGIGRSAAEPAAPDRTHELELLQAQREIRELRERLAWHERLSAEADRPAETVAAR